MWYRQRWTGREGVSVSHAPDVCCLGNSLCKHWLQPRWENQFWGNETGEAHKKTMMGLIYLDYNFVFKLSSCLVRWPVRNVERGDQFWRKNGSRRSLRTWITTVMARLTTLSSSLLSPEFMRLDACIEKLFSKIWITRPKPAYGRQGLAGLWGQDTDEVSTFLVFLTSHFAHAALSLDYITWDH